MIYYEDRATLHENRMYVRIITRVFYLSSVILIMQLRILLPNGDDFIMFLANAAVYVIYLLCFAFRSDLFLVKLACSASELASIFWQRSRLKLPSTMSS